MQAARVRPATPEDATAVRAIYAHYVEHSLATFEEEVPTLHEMERRIGAAQAAGLPFLVACEPSGCEVLGFGYCTTYRPRSAYRFTVEDTVYLRPEARGRGIGRQLLAALLEACTRAGIRQVVAVIADSGDAASVELHRRLGFVDAGRLTAVGHKHGCWIDTIRMQRSLDPKAPPAAQSI